MPLLQPATKALAQVLAGRSSGSGQLGHAQAVAAQADRLISERAHNRLNPAEREEFFEQLARLKLTLADAEVEAEVQAEEEVARPAARPPVAQERLKQMALALTTPDRSRAAGSNGEAEPQEPGAGDEVAVEPAAEAAQERAGEEERESPTEKGGAGSPQEARSPGNVHSGRLQLSRPAAERAASAVASGPRGPRPASPRQSRTGRAETEEAGAEAGDDLGEPAPARRAHLTNARPGENEPREAGSGGEREVSAGNGRAAPRRPRRAKEKGLPEGWVIDEEGFVVPGA